MNSLLVAIILLFSTTQLAICHPQYRKLVCTTPDGLPQAGKHEADCFLVLKDTEDEEPGRNAPLNAGCFKEVVNGTDRVYCDIFCPQSFSAFHAAALQNRACFKFYTYQVEKRGEDWFLWRSGKCLTATATFHLGCKFTAPFKKLNNIDDDDQIFAKLRARAARVAAAARK